jgi:hypothetical protein
MSNQAFVCALRLPMSQLAAVPISSVRIVGARIGTDAFYPIVASQDGECGARLLSSMKQERRVQAVEALSIEVSIDVSSTSLTTLPEFTEALVRSEIEGTFRRDRATVDVLFSAATAASCAAQGIPPQSCPNPPSAVLALVTGAPMPAATSSIDVVSAVAGGLGGALAAAITFGYIMWRRAARWSIHPLDTAKGAVVIRQVTVPHDAAVGHTVQPGDTVAVKAF